MSKKKKSYKNSYKEAQKAQTSVERVVDSAKIIQKTDIEMVSRNSLTLPISEIKKDMNRNIFFALFSVAVLIALYYTRPGYSLINF